jgi:hypothetical protein
LCIFSLGHVVSNDGYDEASLFISGFLEEVQRRKVYRVAAAYIIAAGLIIQIGFPGMGIAELGVAPLIVLLLVVCLNCGNG